MSSANEDEIMKRKLMIDGNVPGDDRRLKLMMKIFLKWCSSSDDSEDQSINYERILLLLTNSEHSMAKSQEVLLMNQLEVQNYEELYKKIENGIDEAQEKIAKCNSELQTAKVILKNKQEYDSLARIIVSHPDRKESLKRLSLLEEEIKKLHVAQEELNLKK